MLYQKHSKNEIGFCHIPKKNRYLFYTKLYAMKRYVSEHSLSSVCLALNSTTDIISVNVYT